MDMTAINQFAMASGLSWASGIRLYGTVFVIGLMAKYGFIHLPIALEPMTNTYVLMASAVLMVIEFTADKIAYVDSMWDAFQTFIRIPAGAILSWGAMGGQDNATIALIAGLLGGSLTGIVHGTKTGIRALVNTSPEPVSNIVTSTVEDGMWITGGLLALFLPFIFLGALAIFLVAFIYLSPKAYRGIKMLIQKFKTDKA